MFDIAISTINRGEDKQYLVPTMSSLFLKTETLPKINLVVGNPDVSYLDCYNVHPKVNIIPCTEGEWDLVKDTGKCNKFNLNFYRCLTQQVDSTQQGRLYLEDDVIFQKNWDETLKNYIEQIKTVYPEFALSIYSAYDLSLQPTEVVRFPRGFYGTQGVFFTSKIMQDFADYIMKNGVLEYKHMADILLQMYCSEKNIPLFVMKNSLIQHIGEESSIHGGKFHKSISFNNE